MERWRRDGFAIIEGFFTPAELEPLVRDYDELYGARYHGDGEPVDFKAEGAIGASHYKQFANIDNLPFGASVELDLISLHPALMAFARDLLDVSDVHLYQSHTWAKFTGEADFDQAFHCDFGNHTLTVPGDDPELRTVDFIFYLTDVEPDLGALAYVTKPDAYAILGEGAVIAPPERQQDMRARERSAAGAAGTLVAHSIDTFHRGTNLTRPGGRRYTMTVGYKAAGNDAIGFHVWQAQQNRDFSQLFRHASPEQLACLGVPLPGEGFWTPRTLQLAQSRWPDWDMTTYREAAR